jgi:hypothetical protein
MGYGKPSRAHTLDLVDDDQLKLEFMIRNLKCEVPECYEPAVGMFKSGVPAWACQSHLNLWKMFRRVIEGAIVSYVRGHMSYAALLAYDDPGETEIIPFGAASDFIMIQARSIMMDVDRYATAPPASPLGSPVTADIPASLVRPPLATLGPENASVILFDPFAL